MQAMTSRCFITTGVQAERPRMVLLSLWNIRLWKLCVASLTVLGDSQSMTLTLVAKTWPYQGGYDMAEIHEGGCLCGTVRYQVEGILTQP